jgi:REP element-mobilizing transposase RayT
MGRLGHILLENHCYHITTATAGRARLFHDHRNALVVSNALQFLRSERAYLLGYVIMPDHLHALLVPRGDQTVSRLMQTIKGYTARVINELDGARGVLWQEGFYDRVIRTERHLRDAITYVHNNPVAAGIVERPEDYVFSSAHPDAQTDIAAFA